MQHESLRSLPSLLPAGHHAALLVRARLWVLNLFHDHADQRLVWHTFARTNDLLSLLARLSREEKLTTEQQFLLFLTGWFAYTGWLFDTDMPVQTAQRLVAQFMQAEAQSEENSTAVVQMLPLTHLEGQASDLVEKVLWDAALALYYGPDYRESQAQRRREAENLNGVDALPVEEWQAEELNSMQRRQYHTATGKASFEPLLHDHIRSLQRKLERRAQRLAQDTDTPVNANSAIQTYFRTAFHNHIHLSAIADRKAQMLISVNAILISVLITVLSYSNLAETRPHLLIPVTVFMICSLGSLIFGVLSARPRVTRLPLRKMAPGQRQQNLLFFGHYTQLDVDQYLTEMMTLQQQTDALCRAMHTDIYHLGGVLDRKYRLVSVAYTLFMAGFVGAVLSFLLVEFLGY